MYVGKWNGIGRPTSNDHDNRCHHLSNTNIAHIRRCALAHHIDRHRCQATGRNCFSSVVQITPMIGRNLIPCECVLFSCLVCISAANWPLLFIDPEQRIHELSWMTFSNAALTVWLANVVWHFLNSLYARRNRGMSSGNDECIVRVKIMHKLWHTHTNISKVLRFSFRPRGFLSLWHWLCWLHTSQPTGSAAHQLSSFHCGIAQLISPPA